MWAQNAKVSPEVASQPAVQEAMEATSLHEWFSRIHEWREGFSPLTLAPDYEVRAIYGPLRGHTWVMGRESNLLDRGHCDATHSDIFSMTGELSVMGQSGACVGSMRHPTCRG